jgi:hypothetical protein
VIAAAILGMDAQRRAGTARLAVIACGEFDADHPADIRLVEPVDPLAVDPADRNVKQQVDDAGEAELGERLHQLRPDALQRLDLGEQRVEDVRAHD